MKYFVALTLVLCALVASRERALAITEYCPARVDALHDFGPSDNGLESFVVTAQSDRVVSGHVIVQMDSGWFSFPFGPVRLTSAPAQYMGEYKRFEVMHYESPVQYVRLPKGSRIKNFWVTDAEAKNDRLLNWDTRGSVSCGPIGEGAPGYPRTGPVHDGRIDLPQNDLAKPPTAQATIIAAVPTESPLKGDCKTVFVSAQATHAEQPDFPKPLYDIVQHGETIITVAIAADGSLEDAWVQWPSGYEAFDIEALRAVHKSTFTPAMALCHPAAALFSFRSTFSL